ncbi:hypothetical protein UAY_03028 [Enterococcus moraviensis ATCC BAA-383]|uniref:Acyltransferase 3 domain-containing protein n=1 Tax=Enterococcus moraviensis ATCC BAA-383 TaxID=1158609 RepID=R2QLM0_9ENTE|nr:acyltransferase family protein [Enterococcus moraviensis]EOH96118.1 hypothetical protein UAY_03028 [Enterococcus moraviensis ATCC BAA-383]EOT66090.1 hypothetical protein I586_02361 [Enterococcus moraviensis ATCC BAA-383]
MKRHFGIDLLRIVSMFMVVILHILGIEGILENVEYGSVNYVVFWGLETLCFVGVNCFALISGYLMITAKWRLKKLIYLWFQVLFYSVLLSVGAELIIGVEPVVPINALFPVATKSYWFFTAYVGLFLFIPLLNKGIHQLSKAELRYGVGIIFLLGTISIFSNSDPFNLYKGYSMIWLIFMYVIGAYIKLHVQIEELSAKKIMRRYLGVNALSILLIIVSTFNPILNESKGENWFIDYVSPLILSSSICLFLLFLKMETSNKLISKGVFSLSPFSFGVYLIHTHPIVFYFILKNYFVDLADTVLIVALMKVFGYGIFIYLVCTAIDFLRSTLFSCVKLDVLVSFIEKKIQSAIENRLKTK